jgi:hypothetical protein
MKKMHQALFVTSALLASNVYAEINLNGFASIVGGVTTGSEETLYGYDDNLDFNQSSLFGLQASSDLGEDFSVTAQILARGVDDWSPKFEWAYVAYDATEKVRILAGRQRAPFYMFSDFLDVSYAYSWIDPPKGVYNIPFDTFDGLGVIYNENIGEFDSSLHVVLGGNTTPFNVGGGSF